MKNIHVLPTDKPSKLYFNHNKGFEKYQFSKEPFINGLTNTTNQHIYITDDSEIKEGDWCYHPLLKGGSIIQSKFDNPNSTMKKIILTSDEVLIKDGVQAIDDEFPEWFCKNSSCKKVEIKTDIKWKSTVYDQPDIEDGYIYKIIIPISEEHKHPKVFSESRNELLFDKYSNLMKEESKQETIEEVAFKYTRGKPFKQIPSQMDFINGAVFGAKWRQENSNINALDFEIDSLKREIKVLKHQQEIMYSEEEVKEILFYRETEYLKTKSVLHINEWFEQIKKK